MTPRIRVLSDELVNRIAAGEVVERPASVVKELVENSLDAGAQRLEVDLEAGGRSLVRVSDDGSGMGPDDALLALERHATSKVSTAEDLEEIRTLGFRGEALPSIAAVSRFTLTTCADEGEGGVRIVVDGGRVSAVEGVARARGTTIEVRSLFFNVPARRKFLRAPQTELRHAQEVVVSAAIANPGVGFVLRHGPRVLIDAPPAPSAVTRLEELEGSKINGEVRSFEVEGGRGVRAVGALAERASSGKPHMTLLVNGRPVRDRLLVGSVLRSLRETGAGGIRLALSLTLPPALVDVNVHPAKTEVRFAEAGLIFSLVDRAVREGLKALHGEIQVTRLGSVAGPAAYGRGHGLPPVRTAEPSLFPHPVYAPTAGSGLPRGAEDWPTTTSGARPAAPDTPLGRLIGQYRSSFLLLEDDEGLVIVDQHVAHERVLYDRIRRRLAGDDAPSQRLLEPLLLELGEGMAGAVALVAPILARVGVEAETFGADTVRVTALPPELEPAQGGRLVSELLELATSGDGLPERRAEQLEEELAASLSCKAAIKINHRLTPAEQQQLLADLAVSENPYRCPHGRPIVLRLSQEEMERRLGRR